MAQVHQSTPILNTQGSILGRSSLTCPSPNLHSLDNQPRHPLPSPYNHLPHQPLSWQATTSTPPTAPYHPHHNPKQHSLPFPALSPHKPSHPSKPVSQSQNNIIHPSILSPHIITTITNPKLPNQHRYITPKKHIRSMERMAGCYWV